MFTSILWLNIILISPSIWSSYNRFWKNFLRKLLFVWWFQAASALLCWCYCCCCCWYWWWDGGVVVAAAAAVFCSVEWWWWWRRKKKHRFIFTKQLSNSKSFIINIAFFINRMPWHVNYWRNQENYARSRRASTSFILSLTKPFLHALSEIEIWKKNRSSSANAELRLAMIIEKDARLPIKILRRSEQSPFLEHNKRFQAKKKWLKSSTELRLHPMSVCKCY